MILEEHQEAEAIESPLISEMAHLTGDAKQWINIGLFSKLVCYTLCGCFPFRLEPGRVVRQDF